MYRKNKLPHSSEHNEGLRSAMEVLAVIAGIVLLAALSWEIIGGSGTRFSAFYLNVQLAVCVVFLLDFFVLWSAAQRKMRYLGRNLLFLLISIPWLNILGWCGVSVTRDWGVVVGLLPVLRAFLAMVIIVRWLTSDNKMRRMLVAYVFTVVIFTYISGLVFFEYEAGVNPKLHGFGNALWWAWMNVTTVGAEIFPVTAIGKVFCIMLPSLGMMFFPIFTTYVLQEYTHKKEADQ
jgi:voltage-gated potassium channel